ncbi:MAG: DUF4249 domain-containing protein [Bacteroidales bacterium]|nr:DUF4249 domain-containing protein [Bacteroidales bacterium]
MKKVQLHTIGMLILLTGLFSCTEIIDIKLDSTYTRLVVYGVITTDSVQQEVQLTASTDYFYTENPPVVKGANVSVSFDNNTVFLEEDEENPGTYRFPDPIRGVTGITYTLNISGVDIDNDGTFELYDATTTMPQIESADSVVLQKFITPFFSGYNLALWSPEPTGRHWYNYKIFRNGEPVNKRLSDFRVQSDDFANDGYISGIPVGFLNDDNEDELLLPGDIVTLEINSITESYNKFIVQAQNEIFGNNPLFSGPPANVYTNLNNDALGIFTAYAIDRVSKIVPAPSFE